MRTLLHALIAIFGWLSGAAVADVSAPTLISLSGPTMGTTWSVILRATADLDTQYLQAGIQRELDKVVAQMSTWEADSTLSRFNAAPAGSELAWPAELMTVTGYALQLARDTEGAYDPTVGPLVNAWGFGPDGGRAQRPPAAQIAQARSRVGWQRLRLDHAAGTALQPGGLYVDLSSIASGFAVDQIAAYLGSRGVHDYLIDVGSEMRAQGEKPGGHAWRVGIQKPLSERDEVQLSIRLQQRGLGTSGDYQHYFFDDGRRYSHTIDPRSAEPVTGDLASVSVLHEQAMQADALAAALKVLGEHAGWDYAVEHQLDALFILRRADGRFEERMTPGFAAAVGLR